MYVLIECPIPTYKCLEETTANTQSIVKMANPDQSEQCTDSFLVTTQHEGLLPFRLRVASSPDFPEKAGKSGDEARLCARVK